MQRGTIEEMQRIADGHGGKCLSKKYLHSHSKLVWQCKEGHPPWSAKPADVKQESWCPFCAGKQKGTIAEMQKIAQTWGGKCLSREYLNSGTGLKWQCKEGHRPWEAVPESIKQGSWCPACAGMQKGTIEEMRKIAEEREGKCLSHKYINTNSKLKWQCKDSHPAWMARPADIKQGSWCPDCAGLRKGTIEEMKKIAKERGGKCLSKKYKGANSKLVWKCKEGHPPWEATPGGVKQGSWCPACAGTQRGTVEEMQRIADERGGKCLSEKYINKNAELIWQCKDGHPPWEATPANIKRGGWCPKCSIHIYIGEEIVRLYFEEAFNKKFPNTYPDFMKGSPVRELDGYNEELKIAFEHHGQQHYKHTASFHKSTQSLKAVQEKDKIRAALCQKHGVRLIVVPSVPDKQSIEGLGHFLSSELRKQGINNFNIPQNLNINSIYKRKRNVIDELRELAKSRKGRLVSQHYLGGHTKLEWECETGHRWKAAPSSVKYGRWCRTCAGFQKGTIEGMQETAKERGGKCLSKKYVNSVTKLTWKCGEGHQWEATPGHIKHGSWCPDCAGVRKGTIEQMEKIAVDRGGKCLSKEYIGDGVKIIWQCEKGHQWETTPNSIKQGSWCLVCAGMQKGTIEGMQKLAEERGGKCLSEKYVSAHSKLRWQCGHGHQWETMPASVKRGYWCPACAGKK